MGYLGKKAMLLISALCVVGVVRIRAEDILNWDNSWSPLGGQHDEGTMLGKRSTSDSSQPRKEENIQERNYSVQEVSYGNDTADINQLIDQIITSRREGRVLSEYDHVYADGNIDQALMQGNDVQARNLVRDKLCALGLMSCNFDIEPKRPYYNKVYVQKPIPHKYAGGPYGPARPMLPPPNLINGRPLPPPPQQQPPLPPHSYGPPRKVGYDSPFKPNYRPTYNGPYLETPPQQSPAILDASFNKPPPSGSIIYGSKPPGPIYNGDNKLPPYQYETPEKIQISASSQQNSFYSQQTAAFTPTTNEIILNNPATAANAVAGNLQQHVHHHFHHVEGVDETKVPNIPLPLANGQTINTDFSALAQSSVAFTPQIPKKPILNQSPAFTTGFNSASHGGLLSQNLNNIASAQKPAGLSSFASGYGQNGASYHSQNADYYKKELHVSGSILGSNNYNSLTAGYNGQSQYAGSSTGYDTSRNQLVDCVCVPINQCPTADRVGRKEDLILPIDPRNLGKDIEALSDDITNNSTASNQQAEARDDSNSMIETTTITNSTEERSKRATNEADDKLSDDDTDDLHIDAQGRKFPPALHDLDSIQRKFLPSYGISFGLPHTQNPNGYPINVLNGNQQPAQNPYFGSIGPNGVNLGLVNVNPLLSVQVQKNDYGEKVVKPLVNLHITPNANLLQNIGNLFKPTTPPTPQSLNPDIFHYHQHNHYQPNRPQQKPLEHPHLIENYAPNAGYGYPNKPVFEYHNGFYTPGTAAINYHSTYNSYSYNNNYENLYGRSSNANNTKLIFADMEETKVNLPDPLDDHVKFPHDRKKRDTEDDENTFVERDSVLNKTIKPEQRAYYGSRPYEKTCRINEVCCRLSVTSQIVPQYGRCGVRNAAGITGRIKNPVYVDGDSEFGEYPWHVAILKKDPKESVYACGGTLIDAQHVITAAHCIKSQHGFDLRARLGEWDVNHDVEFFPYIERDVISVHIHPEYYAGTLDNDLAVLKLDHPVDFNKNPHISPACLPDKFSDYTGARCWTTGWGKDAFGEHGKYQNILKEVDVPILSHHQCESQLRRTRLGHGYKLNPGFICAGGEDGKDACKGDGGGPLVCERNGIWNVVGIVSWGIGCGQANVPGVYVRVAHYLDWLQQITQYYK